MGSCDGPHSCFSSEEMVTHLSICVIKLEKKRDHGSMQLSCNPVFQTLFGASSSLRAIVFSKFTCCNPDSARTRGTLFLSWSLTKDCGVPWPAVFCSSFRGLRLPTELLYVLCLHQTGGCKRQVLYFTRRSLPNAFTSRLK